MNNNDAESIKDKQVLPHDLIMEDILTRVPLESVVKFTLVCKLWCKHLLNDKRFANRHQKISMYSSKPGIIECKFDKNTRNCYLSLFDFAKNKRKIIRFKPESDYRVDNMNIHQSFNGLLLFRRCVKRNVIYDYFVYNPITGRSINLPVPVGVGSEYCKFCLAYDPVGGNYKAVCFGCYDDEYFCKILTLGESGRGSWRNLLKPGFPFHKPYCSPRNGVVFWNGVLYWIVGDSAEEPDTDKKTIYSINISTETLYITKAPSDALRCNLVEMGGMVCYYEWNHVYKQLKLWVLKNNTGNQCEWVRKGNIELERSFQNSARVLPYDDFKQHCQFIEIVTNPKLKIIFLRYRYLEDDGEEEIPTFEYYSCDVEEEKIELVLDSKTHGKWHVNSIAYV